MNVNKTIAILTFRVLHLQGLNIKFNTCGVGVDDLLFQAKLPKPSNKGGGGEGRQSVMLSIRDNLIQKTMMKRGDLLRYEVTLEIHVLLE